MCFVIIVKYETSCFGLSSSIYIDQPNQTSFCTLNAHIVGLWKEEVRLFVKVKIPVRVK